MKTIDTLVKDIYGLFTSEFKPSGDSVETFGRRLARHISNRISEERAGPGLRLSNLGTPCDRKLWYSIRHPDRSESLPPEARFKFLYGDILEELLLFLAEQAGHTIEGQQDEVVLEGVKGHIDAIVDGVLVDVKSASSRSFDKFDVGLVPSNDSFGYLTQLSAYAASLKDDQRVKSDNAGFLVVDKTLGKICFDSHKIQERNWGELISQKKEMLSKDTPPPRGYASEPDGKSGNTKLGVACSYCPFKKTCWPTMRTFIYSNGPRYLVEVHRVPDVPEV